MKKYLSLLMMLMMSIAMSATEITGNCGTNVTYTLDTETGALTIQGTGAMSSYGFSSLNGVDVTTAPWRNYYQTLKSVTISQGVTSIGRYAFLGCSSLTSITIPEGVTSIGNVAFYGCSSLTSVTIPSSVTSIGTDAFYGCSKLETINIKDLGAWCKISGLGNLTGYGVSNKTLLVDGEDASDIIIPNEVTTIPNYCFRSFSNIKSIVIPDGVTSIGNYAFYGCSSLTSVTIPESVTSIGEDAFSNCSSLTTITIPEGVTSIGDKAFYSCFSLTSITIPSSLTSIGDKAFYDCSRLKYISIKDLAAWCSISSLSSLMINGTSSKVLSIDGESASDIVIPEGPESIPFSAFRNFENITSVKIPNSVTNIQNYAFYGCINLSSVKVGRSVASIGDDAFGDNSNLVTFEGGISVKSIGSRVFYNCKSLNYFEVGNNFTSVGLNPFYQCQNLKTINIHDLRTWCSSSATDVLMSCNSLNKTLLIDGKEVTDLVIPDGLTQIARSAFRNVRNITYVDIPSSMSELLTGCFDNCQNIRTINIHDIGAWCGISNLSILTGSGSKTKKLLIDGNEISSIVVPNGVTSVRYGAFRYFTNIVSVSIPKTVISIGSNVFDGCTNLTTLSLPFVGNSKEVDQASTSALFGTIFGTSSGEGMVSIYQRYGSSSYTTYYIPSSLRNVTITGGKLFYGAFYNCENLEITLGDDIEYIGDYAFYNVKNTKSFNISDKVTYIGDHAFDNMNSLNTLYMAGATPATLGATSALSKFTTIYVPNEAARAEYIKDALWADHQAQIITLGTTTDYDVNVTALSDKSALHMTIGEENLINVIKLKVSGTINSYDLMLMRNKMINLKDLDLSDATIVSNSYEYFSNDNIGYKSVDNTLTRYALQPNLFAVKLPKSLTSIESYALEELTHADEIEIPANVLTLGSYAANNLKYLKALTFAENSKLQTIGSYAFYYCSSLKELSIPGSVTVVNNYAFDYCSGLNKLVFEDGEEDMDLYNSDFSAPLTEVYIGRNIIRKYYSGSYTPFSSKYQLKKVTIGNGVTSIPSYLFYYSACNELVVPSSLKSIGTDAFRSNESTDIYIEDVNAWSNIEGLQTLMSTSTAKNFYLNGEKIETLDLTGVETMQPYAFDHATITGLMIPANSTLEAIPNYAFANSQIDKLQMPVSITSVGAYAFSNCTALSEVKLPSSIRSIGNHAFEGCNVLYDVYTYTIEPQVIDQFTFSTYQAATLHCPKVSYYTYFYDTQWSQFLKLVDFDEPYDYIFIDKDFTINDNTGTVGGNPNADINAGGGLIVEGSGEQNLNEIHIKFDGSANVGASLVGNVHAHKIYLDLMVEADKWYYFSFPFNVDLATIQKTGGYVFRYYDGQARANGNTGWKNVEAGTTHLTAGDGYIFSTNTAGLLTIVIDKKTIEEFDLTVDKLTGLNSYSATTGGETSDANKSWNFIGNPYLCYYSMNEMDYNAPVIVWNGTSYEAFRPGDDDYTFYPFQAFFVQKPENVEGVGFDKDNQTTYLQSQDESTKAASRARKARALNSNRKLINLTLTDGTTTDKTRVVFNDEQSLSYEMACDASKFETSGVAQLYSIGADGVKYSINERPIANGEVKLGYVAVKKGEVTISVARMDAHVLLKDAKTGTIFDFSDGDYTFTSEAGAFEGRFTLVLDDEATPIEKVEDESEKLHSTKIYDLNGRRIGEGQRGVNIKDGKKVINQ